MTPNLDKIVEHYNHAREKHPYFCDQLQPNHPRIREVIKATLTVIRKQILQSVIDGNLMFDELLNCELWEAQEAIANGNKAQTVEELYDCVAVLLRTIDVVEGRQKLGKPMEYYCQLEPQEVNEAVGIIDKALAAHPRNCDVGTAEEQHKRHDKFCNATRNGISGYHCEHAPRCVLCFSMWAQMPYEEGEAK